MIKMSKNERAELFVGLAIVFAGIVIGLLFNPCVILAAMLIGGAIGVSAGNEDETIIYDVTIVETEEES